LSCSAIATALARSGAHIALTDISEDVVTSAEHLAATTSVRAVGIVADVTDERVVHATVAETAASVGDPTVLVNSAGIGLNANGLGARFGARVGMPQPYIRRRILDSWDMNEALEAVFASQQSLCTNLLLSHRDGFAIDLETTPGRHGWGYPTDGVLVHTNHFRYFVPKQIEGTYRYFSPDSLYRADRIERVLARAPEATTGEAMRALIREALADHFGFPDAVCNHPNENDPWWDRNETVASSIVDLTTGEYRIAHGNPCENDYELLPWSLYDAPVAAAAR
jgi:isopenicillin-N N-acyltransferase-like protein